ncbi:division plane positioning ATPase MipZ [Deinococcus sp.]|uniref:nucleotide-binding protein n=1 Tax=Deinococcus sp. TaxID=47478 RepID=UPI003CC6183B
MPAVIAITSEKGGVGKSTLAVHLAGALSERGLHVTLVDEDGRVGSSIGWAQRSLKRSPEQGHVGLGFEVLEPDEVRPRLLRDLDALVIDTEGRPKRKELRDLSERADTILLPSGVSTLELESTLTLAEFLTSEGGARRKLKVILTRVPPTSGAGERAREDLREAGLTVCNTLVRQYAAYLRAAELGVLCRDLPAREDLGGRAAQAWQDILSLSREVL